MCDPAPARPARPRRTACDRAQRCNRIVSRMLEGLTVRRVRGRRWIGGVSSRARNMRWRGWPGSVARCVWSGARSPMASSARRRKTAIMACRFMNREACAAPHPALRATFSPQSGAKGGVEVWEIPSIFLEDARIYLEFLGRNGALGRDKPGQYAVGRPSSLPFSRPKLLRGATRSGKARRRNDGVPFETAGRAESPRTRAHSRRPVGGADTGRPRRGGHQGGAAGGGGRYARDGGRLSSMGEAGERLDAAYFHSCNRGKQIDRGGFRKA